MNRRFGAAALALMLCGTALTGCGTVSIGNEESSTAETSAQEPEEKNEIHENENGDFLIVNSDGSTVLMTADGSVITEKEEGMEWSYLAGSVTMMFPSDWKDRFVVQDAAVYCKACWDAQENTGELFELEFVDEKGMVTGPEYTALLGNIDKMFVTALVPDAPNYNTEDNALFAEYSDMAQSIGSILSTAVCSGYPDFKPIFLTPYARVTDEPSKLCGEWLDSGAAATPGQAFYPYVVFRGRDGAFGYRYGVNDLSFGSFLVNKNAKDYVWNTDKWGDAGLVFTHGAVYRVTYYESAQMTLKFELVLTADESSEDALTQTSFVYDRDYQEIYQGNGDSTEVEF